MGVMAWTPCPMMRSAPASTAAWAICVWYCSTSSRRPQWCDEIRMSTCGRSALGSSMYSSSSVSSAMVRMIGGTPARFATLG